ATLRLESQPEGNPLDDGVEILAQTPGKRLQPLTLLSGGERALTALAFLFALQAVKPSPFYVLDEVDAALDDANVVRFNRVLKRLAADQQFLIVTRNHSTMAQAEVLYGVTLAEHGISRIVSVRLQHDALIPGGELTASRTTPKCPFNRTPNDTASANASRSFWTPASTPTARTSRRPSAVRRPM